MKAAPPAFVHAYYNWTGWYIGGHVGYGWADLSNPILGGAGFSPSGMTYGLQGGFNYQMGSWVFGIEGEYSWADLKDTQGVVGVALRRSQDRPASTTSAGRIGYAFDRTMIYGKFGYAWTQEEYNFTALGGTATGGVDRNGWVIGAGIEYAFAGNWTAKLEYNYFDMGSKLVDAGDHRRSRRGAGQHRPYGSDRETRRQLQVQLGPLR